MTIPWGDVATAYYSTGIPDIEVYLPAPPLLALGMRLIDPLRPLLGRQRVQDWLKGQVDKRIAGPDQAARGRLRTWVWGEARNARGERRTARLETANVYDLTLHGVLLAVRHLLDYQGPGGYFTPSRLLARAASNRCPAPDESPSSADQPDTRTKPSPARASRCSVSDASSSPPLRQ